MKAILLLSTAFLGPLAPVAAPTAAAQDAGPAPVAAASAPTSPREAFARLRALRAEAVEAANGDDLDTAAARLAEADGLVQNHPGLMLLRARVAAMQGDGPAAVALLQRYAGAGLVANVEGDAALAAVAGTPGFAEAAARIAANRAPVGADRLTALFEIPGADLVESVAYDEANGRWLVSQVAGRTILAVDDDGAVTPFLTQIPVTAGLLGLAMDSAHGWLWVASAPLPPAAYGLDGPALPATALLRIELATGQINAWFSAPDDGLEHGFGDVALGPDGTAYVADSLSGAIHRYAPGSEGLTAALAPGLLNSPQGMVTTPDGAALIVADYSTGLHRVNLTTGQLEAFPAPADASLIGIDGLTTDGTALYAFQNGTSPQRVLKLAPDADWRRIVSIEVLAANLPEIDEPTTGLVRNGELVFVSRSQWSEFGDDGAPRTVDPAPAIIARLRLD